MVIKSLSGFYSKLLNERLIEVVENQSGFRKNSGSSDNIFILNTALWKARALEEALWLCLITESLCTLEILFTALSRVSLLSQFIFNGTLGRAVLFLHYCSPCISWKLERISCLPRRGSWYITQVSYIHIRKCSFTTFTSFSLLPWLSSVWVVTLWNQQCCFQTWSVLCFDSLQVQPPEVRVWAFPSYYCCSVPLVRCWTWKQVSQVWRSIVHQAQILCILQSIHLNWGTCCLLLTLRRQFELNTYKSFPLTKASMKKRLSETSSMAFFAVEDNSKLLFHWSCSRYNAYW